MSTRLSIGKPYIVATLPRAIDQSTSRYVVGEVYGVTPGSRKRKRPELAVGVDGEGVNIYDITSTKLITSYALPPQTSFTCPPASLRVRASQGAVERRTYVSTKGTDSQIRLFSESRSQLSSAAVSTVMRTLATPEKSVVYMATTSSSRPDVLAVMEDGEICCLDGDTLQDKWISPSSALGRESSTSSENSRVEFALLSSAFAASQGIFKERQDLFSVFPQELSEHGYNPDILIIIRKLHGPSAVRAIEVVTLPRRSTMHNKQASVEPLLSTTLTPSTHFAGNFTFSLQVSTGHLQQFTPSSLTTYDLTSTIPNELSRLKIKDGDSYLRLSSTATLVSTKKAVTLYNPKYQTILASVPLIGTSKSDQSKRKRRRESEDNDVAIGASGQPFKLVSYFPKINVAIAIADNDLVAIQIEGGSRTSGLLIDSLGCPVRNDIRPGRKDLSSSGKIGLTTMNSYLPGSIGLPEVPMAEQVKPVKAAAEARDAAQFDILMAEKLGGDWIGTGKDAKQQPEDGISNIQEISNFFERPRASEVDKRWVIYALHKIFSLNENDIGEYKLGVSFYPPNVFMWLLQTGYMTIANLESALKKRIRSSALDAMPTGLLASVLADMDQSMGFLYELISKNLLPAGELVYAIRILMESLGLFGDNEAATQRAIMAREEAPPVSEDHNMEEEVKELEAQIESDLALAESRLSDDTDIRGDALDLALARLYKCSSEDIVYALQTTFTGHQTMALIYQLRFQLRNGSWTSRYADISMVDDGSEEGEPQENSMMVICGLLHNCIDSIGAGGWISGDLRLVNGDPFEAQEFIAGLSFEVSAALEGIEESSYLKGLLQCMVGYGETLQGPLKKQKTTHTTNTPVLLPLTDEAFQTLPIGLKVDQKIALKKIASGGEILNRSMRDIGRLKSKKVGKYSLERIVL